MRLLKTITRGAVANRRAPSAPPLMTSVRNKSPPSLDVEARPESGGVFVKFVYIIL